MLNSRPTRRSFRRTADKKVRCARAARAFADALQRRIDRSQRAHTGGVKVTPSSKGTMRITSESPESGDGVRRGAHRLQPARSSRSASMRSTFLDVLGALEEDGRAVLGPSGEARSGGASVRRAIGNSSRSSCRCASDRAGRANACSRLRADEAPRTVGELPTWSASVTRWVGGRGIARWRGVARVRLGRGRDPRARHRIPQRSRDAQSNRRRAISRRGARFASVISGR